MKHKAKCKLDPKITFFAAVLVVLLLILKIHGVTLVQAKENTVPVGSEVCFIKENTAFPKTCPRKGAGQAPAEDAVNLQPADKAAAGAPAQAADCNLQVCVAVCNKGQTTAQDILLAVPLLGTLDSPYQTLIQEDFSMKPLQIKKQCLCNRSAIFKINSLAPGKTERIVLNYGLLVTPLQADLTLYEPVPASCGRQQVDPLFLQPADKIESRHPEIAAKAHEVTDNLKNNLEKAQAIFSFVLKHMDYDLQAPYSNCGALSALRGGKGVCEDYAALFVALCRAEKIPARPVYGYTNPLGWEEISSSGPEKALSLTGCRHCWAEFYLEGLGWLPADPTLNTYNCEYPYFASLPQAGHLAQNYADRSLQVCYQGGQIDVTWEEKLTGLHRL